MAVRNVRETVAWRLARPSMHISPNVAATASVLTRWLTQSGRCRNPMPMTLQNRPLSDSQWMRAHSNQPLMNEKLPSAHSPPSATSRIYQ